jgi:hypothetical protein
MRLINILHQPHSLDFINNAFQDPYTGLYAIRLLLWPPISSQVEAIAQKSLNLLRKNPEPT